MRSLAALTLLAAAAAAAELSTAEREIARVAESVRPSVVTVITPRKDDLDLTGVVISSEGVVLTLRGLLADEAGKLPVRVSVRFPGRGKTVEAELIDEDAISDTVLLGASGVRARPVLPRPVAEVRLGSWVLLVGNTFGAGRESTPTTSLGVLAGIVRDNDRIIALHASTLVNPGSFGAPVIDTDGGLLGITAYKVTESGGLSVVIPFDFIRRRYESKGGKGARAFRSDARVRGAGLRVSDALGLVVEAAVARAAVALVGVRAGEPPAEAAPAEAAPEQPAPAQEAPPEKAPKQPQIPQPAPVPGRLPGVDRSSGLVISADGLVLCPLRVTGWPGPERPLTVDLRDGRELPARVVGRDERLRLALLAVQAGDLPVLELAPAESLQAGRFAIALGFPHEEPHRATPQVTVGILSRTGALGQLHAAFQALQTDAAVSGGNRGGPLLDMEGRLMGIILDVNDTEPRGYHLRAAAAYAGNAGLGFAVPATVLGELLPRLRAGATLKAAFLGISAQPVPEGLSILAVTERNSKGEETAARRAGLVEGDILVSIDGEAVADPVALRRVLGRRVAGDRVEIVLLRGAERRTATVELGEP